MATKSKWIVITSGDRSLEDISKDLSKKGFSVHQKLDAIGQITGEGDDNIKTEGMKIKGITHILSMHDDINIGGPDSSETW